MRNSQTADRNSRHRSRARILLWPTAMAIFLFTVSYPANDFYGATSASDIGLGLFLVYVGIALVTAGVVFALILPWALRREGSGAVALALAIPGTAPATGRPGRRRRRRTARRVGHLQERARRRLAASDG